MNDTLRKRPPRYKPDAPPANPLQSQLWHLKQASGLTAQQIAGRMSQDMGVPRRDPSSVTAFIRMGSAKAAVPRAFARAIRASTADTDLIIRTAEQLAREYAARRTEKRQKINTVL